MLLLYTSLLWYYSIQDNNLCVVKTELTKPVWMLYCRDLYGSYIIESLRKWSPASWLWMCYFIFSTAHREYRSTTYVNTHELESWPRGYYLLFMLKQAAVPFFPLYAMSNQGTWPRNLCGQVKPALWQNDCWMPGLMLHKFPFAELHFLFWDAPFFPWT